MNPKVISLNKDWWKKGTATKPLPSLPPVSRPAALPARSRVRHEAEVTKVVHLPELMTVDECARHLKVHPDSVYRWASQGLIRVRRVGNRIRVPVTAIQEFLNG